MNNDRFLLVISSGGELRVHRVVYLDVAAEDGEFHVMGVVDVVVDTLH